MHPRTKSRRRDRRALRAALASLAAVALAAGAALLPSAAYAAEPRTIEGWMQPKGEIGLAEGQVTAHPGSDLSQVFPTIPPDEMGAWYESLDQKAELNGQTIGDDTTDALASGQTSSWVVYRRNTPGPRSSRRRWSSATNARRWRPPSGLTRSR